MIFFSYISETVWTFYFFNWGEVLSLSSCWVKKWQHYFVPLTLSAVCSFFGAPKVFCGKKGRDLVERKVLGRSQLETAACQSERGGVEHPFWIGTLTRRNPINKFTFLLQKTVIKILVNYSEFLPQTSKCWQFRGA